MPKSKKTIEAWPPKRTNSGKSQHKTPLKIDRAKLAESLETRLQFKVRDFQLQAIEAQLLGKDVVVHAGTGSGKTLIAAAPHLCQPKFGVTLFVSPLIGLQNEQVETFKTEFGLKAIAVNSSFGGCTPEVLRGVLNSDPDIIILSPEMLLSKRFIEEVLRRPDFTRRVAAVVVDEAHVVSHWGSGFRKKYGELGMVRAFLPKETAMVALSATLPARVRRDVISKLQIKNTDFTLIDVGNDRKNVSLIVRPIHSTLSSFVDLDFVIPNGVQDALSIPKTFIYYDNVMGAVDMENHLIGLLPEHLRDKHIIRSYSAPFSDEYKTKVMDDFRKGDVRILICTDAAGMGCNIPDVEVVVQWKLPVTLSSFVQRAGRAARSPGIEGRAILLVEKSAYSVVVLGQLAETLKQSKLTPTEKKKKIQEYAEEHGVSRGAVDPKGDAVYLKVASPVDSASENEGLHAFVQTGLCRRAILTEVFENDKPEPTAKCCDLCHPELLDLTRPGTDAKPTRRKRLKKRETPLPEVEKKLVEWRKVIWNRDFGPKKRFFGSSALMNADLVSLLASLGPLSSKQDLLSVLESQHWLWREQYGDGLYEMLSSLSVPPIPPKPRGTKRKETDEDVEVTVEPRKQPRVDTLNSDEQASHTLPRGNIPSAQPSSSSTSVPRASQPITFTSPHTYPPVQAHYAQYRTPTQPIATPSSSPLPQLQMNPYSYPQYVVPQPSSQNTPQYMSSGTYHLSPASRGPSGHSTASHQATSNNQQTLYTRPSRMVLGETTPRYLNESIDLKGNQRGHPTFSTITPPHPHTLQHIPSFSQLPSTPTPRTTHEHRFNSQNVSAAPVPQISISRNGHFTLPLTPATPSFHLPLTPPTTAQRAREPFDYPYGRVHGHLP